MDQLMHERSSWSKMICMLTEPMSKNLAGVEPAVT